MSSSTSIAAKATPIAKTGQRRWALARIVGALLLIGLLGASSYLLPVKELLGRALDWIASLGAWGPAILGASYIPATVLLVPGSVLTLGAGFLFGVVKGTIAVSLGSTAGSTAAFLIARTLGRRWVEARVAGDAKFQAIDRAVAEHGFKIVLLVRLSPIFPYNLLGYALGVTKVRLRDYVLASWIGMLPGTILYVYVGSAVRSLSDILSGNIEGGVGQKVLFGVGLLATIAVTLLVTRIARKAIREAAPGVEETTP